MKNSLSVFVITTLITLTPLSQAGDLQTLFHQQLETSKEGIHEVNSLTKASNHGIKSIGIERTTCYGTCPAYSFIVKTDGSFKYVGENYVEHIGEYTGTIPTYRLKKVLEVIAELDFASLGMQYTSNVTDMPAVYTLVEQDGKAKVIENYANVAPASLWAIEELIDSLVNQIDWDKATSSDSY